MKIAEFTRKNRQLFKRMKNDLQTALRSFQDTGVYNDSQERLYVIMFLQEKKLPFVRKILHIVPQEVRKPFRELTAPRNENSFMGEPDIFMIKERRTPIQRTEREGGGPIQDLEGKTEKGKSKSD